MLHMHVYCIYQSFVVDAVKLSFHLSHIGIRGNEHADEAAKAALNLSVSAVKCPATDLYPEAANHCQHLWLAEWDGCVSNKLHAVKPLLGYSNLSSLSRQDAVVLKRLRTGHTHLTHSYLLNQQDQPQCSNCDCALTVEHVLLECNHYNVARQRYLYFNVSSLYEFFDTVSAQNILGFIRDIGLYRLLWFTLFVHLIDFISVFLNLL